MFRILTDEVDVSAAADPYVVQHDVAIFRDAVRLWAGVVIARVERDGHLVAADTDFVVANALHQAATMDVGLDANPVVRSIEGEVPHQHIADTAKGLGADRHAVPAIEVVVHHAHMLHAGATALDGDVVVAGADVGLRNGDVRGASAGIDAIGVAGVGGGIDLNAPGREALASAVDHVEVGGVFQGDAIQREIIRAIRDDEARHLLPAARAGLFGELPPGDGAMQKRGSAAPVDHAIPHHGRVRRLVDGDERLAPRRLVVDQAAASRGTLVEPRVARREQGDARVQKQGYAGRERERTGEEGVAGSIGSEFHGLSRPAAVEGGLQPTSVQPGLIGLQERAAGRDELGCDLRADGRDLRFRNLAPVLADASRRGRRAGGEQDQGWSSEAHGRALV